MNTGNGQIRSNRAKCRKCESVISSFFKGDWKTCRCGAITIGGGLSFYRRGGDLSSIIEMSEPKPLEKEIEMQKKAKRTYLTNEQKAQLKKEWRFGTSVDKLMSKYKVSKITVHRIIGVAPIQVWNGNGSKPVTKTRKRRRKANNEDGFAELRGFLEGNLAAHKFLGDAKSLHPTYKAEVKGWDRCAQEILTKLEGIK